MTKDEALAFLGRELEERLRPHVPEGYASAEWIANAVEWLWGVGDSATVDDLTHALWLVLSQVQDDVAEDTAEPWPRGATRAEPLPVPEVDERDGVWELRYGPAAAPVLRLTPLPIPPP